MAEPNPFEVIREALDTLCDPTGHSGALHPGRTDAKAALALLEQQMGEARVLLLDAINTEPFWVREAQAWLATQPTEEKTT